jgi:signal transduction histidine kinase
LNLEKVLQYQDSSIAIGARINNRDVNRTIELLKIQYETESKNRQLEQQKSELQKQQLALIALVLTLLLIISVILLYLVNRNKIRQLRIANQNRKVSEMLMEAELKERERIARDLHDSVSQKLAVIQMHLSVGIEEDPDLFTRISSLLNESVADVRSISHNLFPRDLNKGIIPALEYLCEQCNFSCSQIHFSFKLSTAFEVRKIPSNLEFVIYRIVQELINNAIKHSKATNVDIVLEYDSARILLSISDNGIGFDSALIKKGKGIGLKNIMERIKKIGGNLELYSEVNEGTKFQIKIPY